MLRKINKTACNTVIVTIIFFCIASVCAAEIDTGFFIGGSLGQTYIKNNFSYGDGDRFKFDEDDLGYRLFGGYRLNHFLACEGGYRSFGETDDNSMIGKVKSETTNFDLFAVGLIPIAFIDLYAKAGVAFWNTDSRIGDINEDDDGQDFIWGAGIAARIRSFSVRLEWEQIEADHLDRLQMLSLGVAYTF